MAENLIIFKAISNCVKDLGESFAKNQRSLLLYKHLIEKTTIIHEEPIKKHIAAWKKYCLDNSHAILHTNENNLQGKIEYSKKVVLDLNQIFEIASNTDKKVIWQHLLNIHAFMDPTSKAKELLKKQMENGGKEDEFLHNIIDKVEKEVDPTADPMAAVSSIMNSGIFTDLVQGMNSGINNGTMDMGKLLGSVNKMVASLGSIAGSNMPSEMTHMTDMFSSMMDSVGANINNSNSPHTDTKQISDSSKSSCPEPSCCDIKQISDSSKSSCPAPSCCDTKQISDSSKSSCLAPSCCDTKQISDSSKSSCPAPSCANMWLSKKLDENSSNDKFCKKK